MLDLLLHSAKRRGIAPWEAGQGFPGLAVCMHRQWGAESPSVWSWGAATLCTGSLKWDCAGCLAAPGVRGERGGVLVPLDRVTKEPGRQQLWQGAAYKA